MDTIASLNFGLVIAATLGGFGLEEKREKMRHTVLAGVFAGTILALVYILLAYMGMCSSGVYAIQENGAWTLRRIVFPVSYTHLDVYKRQAADKAEAVRQQVCAVFHNEHAGGIELKPLLEVLGVEAVSYTHLDVYKRQ